jgi:hypothetical protein
MVLRLTVGVFAECPDAFRSRRPETPTEVTNLTSAARTPEAAAVPLMSAM